ncbi:hypothetical protein CLIB1423_34S00606 [[Candida] railenensis]|uniref:Uncharacterized protein n=1 Tax=[Candida] railenensis TaxID=45579 RepID=A0A9P0QWX3_9ASCO|nr:hypothetical protein CLIB1423_34S00606 [[Candida] railenensis]
MSSIESLNQLYHSIISQIGTLESKNEDLEVRLKVQADQFTRQIEGLQRELKFKDEEIRRLENGSACVKLGPPPRLPFTPVSSRKSPAKRRKIVIKQERSDEEDMVTRRESNLESPQSGQPDRSLHMAQEHTSSDSADRSLHVEQVPNSDESDGYLHVEQEVLPLSGQNQHSRMKDQRKESSLLPSDSPIDNQYQDASPLARLSPIKSEFDLDLRLLQKLASSQNAEDSEFARLPTQYSEQSNSPVKSTQLGLNLSPVKPTQIRTSPYRSQQSDTVSTSNCDADIEVVDDSDEEYDLLRSPLVDITNTKSNLTPLQLRDQKRIELNYKLRNDPDFKISLGPDSIHPVYQQRWMISDFEPNPKYVKQKLKRKVGKTWKEQQEIDRFYKLAGPGVQLKLIQWNNEDDKENYSNKTKAPQISQLYDRFPSPPGFNEVDFPTTQEEMERKLHSERVQSVRIQSRLAEATKPGSGSHVFREKLLNEYVKAERFTT